MLQVKVNLVPVSKVEAELLEVRGGVLGETGSKKGILLREYCVKRVL